MAKKKGQKDKPIVDKELHKKIKIEQYKSTTKKKRVWSQVLLKGKFFLLHWWY